MGLDLGRLKLHPWKFNTIINQCTCWENECFIFNKNKSNIFMGVFLKVDCNFSNVHKVLKWIAQNLTLFFFSFFALRSSEIILYYAKNHHFKNYSVNSLLLCQMSSSWLVCCVNWVFSTWLGWRDLTTRWHYVCNFPGQVFLQLCADWYVNLQWFDLFVLVLYWLQLWICYQALKR